MFGGFVVLPSFLSSTVVQSGSTRVFKFRLEATRLLVIIVVG